MTHRHGPVYLLKECAECRVALIHSMRPSRKKQEAAIYFIERLGVDRSQILRELKP